MLTTTLPFVISTEATVGSEAERSLGYLLRVTKMDPSTSCLLTVGIPVGVTKCIIGSVL